MCVILAYLMPRVVLFFIWLLTNWFHLAFHTILGPFLGFLFLPYTTLVWMGAMLNNHQQIGGLWLVLLVIAVLCDLGGHGHAARRKW